jgi:hypothetical protein
MTRIFTLLILLFPVLLVGQIDPSEDSAKKLSHSNDYVSSGIDEKEIEGYLKEDKLKFNMQAGAVFGTGFGSGEYFGTYVSPQVNYRLSPKLTVKTGVTLYQSFGNPNKHSSSESTFGYPSSNFTQSFLYVSGAYQFTDRLVFSGTVYKSVNLFNQQNNYQGNKKNDYEGMIMGIDYKVGKNVFIQGQIEISNNPYSRYSYPHSGFGNGFGTNNFDAFPHY